MNKIPKILHLFWDKSSLSYLHLLTIKSFLKYNPDWKIYVYSPDYAICTGLRQYTGYNYFSDLEKITNVSMKSTDSNLYKINPQANSIILSDLFRYNILYEVGGVWSDFDVLWIKPIEHLSKCKYVGKTKVNTMGGMVCMYNMTHGFHSIGVLMCSPQNKFMKIIRDQAISTLSNDVNCIKDYQSIGSHMLNHLFPTIESITDRFEDILGFNYSTFYPYDSSTQKLYNKNDLNVTDNSVCVHWFYGHESAKKFIENNLKIDCSLKSILKNEGWL